MGADGHHCGDLTMATGMFSGSNPNRSVLGAQQLQRPADPYLRQQYPEVYGALGGFMGMAPDEMSGSIFDPNTARVRAGAEYGFPVGTAAQVIPAVGLLAPVVKASARALGPTAVRMGEGYLQRQGLMLNAKEPGIPSLLEDGFQDSLPAAVDAVKLKPGSITNQKIIDKFGSKAERERLLQKRVLQDAEDVAEQEAASLSGVEQNLKTEPVKNVRAAYKGSAVPADFWRKLQEQKGSEVVLRAVRLGKHLRPDGKGGYVGAPRHIDSPQALAAFRRSLDQQFKDGVEIIEAADPTRVGTWYDRAKEGSAYAMRPCG